MKWSMSPLVSENCANLQALDLRAPSVKPQFHSTLRGTLKPSCQHSNGRLVVHIAHLTLTAARLSVKNSRHGQLAWRRACRFMVSRSDSTIQQAILHA